MQGLIVLIVVEAILHLFAAIVCVYDISAMFLTPGKIYNMTKVNWFGAIFIYISYFCVVPIYAIVAFMIWICTVGRKK